MPPKPLDFTCPLTHQHFINNKDTALAYCSVLTPLNVDIHTGKRRESKLKQNARQSRFVVA